MQQVLRRPGTNGHVRGAYGINTCMAPRACCMQQAAPPLSPDVLPRHTAAHDSRSLGAYVLWVAAVQVRAEVAANAQPRPLPS